MLKRAFLLFFLLASVYVVIGQAIPEKPNPPRLVNDFVGNLLSAGQVSALENKLRAYNDSTSTQVVIVIVDSVEPYDMNTYALELGRKWGVGQKETNNGVILLWAPGDRKVYIATGYGMEGVLPDAYANRIVDQAIIPRFKQIKYYEGLDAGIDAIMKYASGEYKAEPQSGGGEDSMFPIIVFFIIIIVFIYISRKGGGRGGRGPGGGMPYSTYTGWGRSSGNWGGGGFGGGFGGGSSGGGFGGFGGGSFGGGGAGGSY